MEWSFLPFIIVVVLLLYRWGKNSGGRNATRKRDQMVIDSLQPVYTALEKGEKPDEDLIKSLVKRHELRGVLYRVLDQAELAYLVPKELVTYEAAGAADLAFYLMHPAELGEVVNDIVYLETVSRTWESPDGPVTLQYHVYKFLHRTGEWVAGVAGPVIGDDLPYAPSRCTMTYYEAVDAKSAEEHVDRVHESLWPRVAEQLTSN